MTNWKKQKELVLMCAYYIVRERYSSYKGMKRSPDARRLYALMRRIGDHINAEALYYIRAEYWHPMAFNPSHGEAWDKANEILRENAYY